MPPPIPAAPLAPCGWPICDLVADIGVVIAAVQGNLKRAGLDAIIQYRRRAMQVYVVDFFGVATRVLQRQLHCARGFVARLFKTHAMIGVAGGAIAGNLRVDFCAAFLRVLDSSST